MNEKLNIEQATGQLTRKFDIRRVDEGRSERVVDTVAAEEPLAIHIEHWFKDARRSESLALTMRTPGNDRELAAGFLLSEGIIRGLADLQDLRPLGIEPSNEILAELSKGVDVESWRLARESFQGSSCGICGKRSREALSQQIASPIQGSFSVRAEFIELLPNALRIQQDGFEKTGGLHAAALVSQCGEVEAVFEDIGRHNALDKLLGDAFLAGQVPLHNKLVFMSSRSSFELVQKAAMAGAPVLATVGGPSSLAIEAAREYGITLIGFVREQRFNVYSGEWRINS